MKHCSSSSSLALVLLLAASSSAFVPAARNHHGWSSSSSMRRSSTATPQETTTTTKLTPPPSQDEIMQQQGAVQDLYDKNVQKTYGRYPLTIKSGKGCKLYTSDGKEYLDCVSGIATCALGHSNDALTAAVTEQMNKVHHVSNLYLIPAQAALANWLITNSAADKAFFCNSGAEANEAAIKCARRHASNRGIERPIIISAENSFHGRTLAALTATGQTKYHKGFGCGPDNAMVPGFTYVPYNDVQALKAKVNEIQNTPGQGLAGILMEPLQGEGGIVPGTVEFFEAIREICDDTGALMICDEVQVGMGRSGTLWGHEQLGGVVPDVFTSAKALGGGVPIGAMMARGEAASVFGPGDHASTYGGNPLACAAGLAVAQYFSDHDVLDNVRQRGEQLSAGLQTISEKYPTILEQNNVRGWGLLKGIAVVSKDESITSGAVVQAAMDQGLLLVGAGANVVRFVPPLIITEQEIDRALDLFDKALETVAAKNLSP